MPLSTVVVAPTSTSCRAASFRPEVEVARWKTRVMVEQMAAVDWSRLGEPVGHLTASELEDIDGAALAVLALTGR